MSSPEGTADSICCQSSLRDVSITTSEPNVETLGSFQPSRWDGVPSNPNGIGLFSSFVSFAFSCGNLHLLRRLNSQHLQPLLENPRCQIAQRQTRKLLSLAFGLEHRAIFIKPRKISR